MTLTLKTCNLDCSVWCCSRAISNNCPICPKLSRTFCGKLFVSFVLLAAIWCSRHINGESVAHRHISPANMHFQGRVSVFLCILGVAQLVSAGKSDDLLSRLVAADVEMCSKDTGVDVKEFEEARENRALNHSMLCFLKCAMEKIGFLKDGHVQIDQAKEAFPGKMTDSLEECFQRIGPISSCDDVQKAENCLPTS